MTIGLEGRCSTAISTNEINELDSDLLQEQTPQTIEEIAPAVKGFPALHRIKMRHADGLLHTHVYAWRGGPKIGKDEPEEILLERQKDMVERYGGRAKRIKSPKSKPNEERRKTLTLYVSRSLQNAKHRAAKKKLNFTIDAQLVVSLIEKQDWKCAVSGIDFQPNYDVEGRFTYNPYGISIDRIDCSEGYTRGNIQLVLTAVNFAMNEWGEEIYRDIARHVVARDLLTPR